ncbi:hypothetical protein [Roseivirga echinicomitans]|uniref:HYR domain-containing protein n=1 Tax=Roseivirga echinicomitans TaxID=296218 RepID=A0A150X109_9BACT|nr:hypothetical protein [Roseivirga echinicomitans]KYG72424.1 hypothetical protein AWN68_11725 [Roseivirga echinicomitans]
MIKIYAKTIFIFLAFLMLKSPAFAFQIPSNDTRQSAFQIPLGPNGNFFSKEDQFSISGASGDGTYYSQWGSRASRSVWFKFKAPASDKIIITVEGQESYIQLALVTLKGEELASSAFGYPVKSEQLMYSGLREGEEYFIVVDNPIEGKAMGQFALNFQNYLLTMCTQPYVLALDKDGKGTIEIDDLLNADCYWPCAGVECSRELNKSTFDCDDLGENYVTIKGVGANGTVYYGTTLVKVIDNIPPTIAARNIRANITDGNSVKVDPKNVILWRCGVIGSIPSPDPVPGAGQSLFFQETPCAKDNCGIVLYELSKTTFTCADLGENEVTARVVDKSGNEATTKVMITIYDLTAPVARAINATVYLGADGLAKADADLMDGGSTAGCDGYETSLNKSVFDYNDLGENEVSFIIKDDRDNLASVKVKVTVRDTISPVVVSQPSTMYLDKNGRLEVREAKQLVKLCDDAAVMVREQTGGFEPDGSKEDEFFEKLSKQEGCTKDNAQISEFWIEPREFTSANLGENEVDFFVSDMSGNSTSAKAKLTILPFNVSCKNELWAIKSGEWNDPNIWSDKENGEVIGVVPCETTTVNIKGRKVDFITEEEITVKTVNLLEGNSPTELYIQVGSLKLKEAMSQKGNVTLKQSQIGKLEVIKK